VSVTQVHDQGEELCRLTRVPEAERGRLWPSRAGRSGRELLALVLVVGATALMTACAVATPAWAETVTGRLSYDDRSTTPSRAHPIVGARVEVWRFRPRTLGIWAWGRDATAKTDHVGTFRVNLPFSAAGVTVALRVFTENNAAWIAPPSAGFYAPGEDYEMRRVVNSPATVASFDYTFRGPVAAREFNIISTLWYGYRYALANRDPAESDPLPRVNVGESSWPSEVSWYNPVHDALQLNPGDSWRDETLLHEYGHFLQEQLSSLHWAPAEHRPCDLDKDAAFAWLEGFATYFAEVVRQSVRGAQLSGSAELESSACFNTGPAVDGTRIERYVTGALYDLYDLPTDPGSVVEAHDTVPGADGVHHDRQIFQIFDRELDRYGTAPTIGAFRAAWLARGLPREIDRIFAHFFMPVA